MIAVREVRSVNALENRIALVTGAGRGIGAATALRLARAGASVVVNDLDVDAAASSASAIEAAGGKAIACAGDLTGPDVPERLIAAAVDAFGGLDIVVNNAGYIWNGAMHKHTDEQWQAMLDVHATAPFRVLRAFHPVLKAQFEAERARGETPRCRKVVNVSSVSGTRGEATQIAYSAGKAAVVGITRTLAQEWGRFNVTVNAVAFGHIETRLTQPYEGEPPRIPIRGRELRVGLTHAQIEQARTQSPLGRSGTVADAAGAIYLFCIPESDFVSGEVLVCAGGG
jgi:3-oxoacyl-[acyl-carrier protein] reductase